ncbi:MAG: SPOR domain-containing protein, partial [bacterium]|nr:SPOR domain-containing protein [bacterium]
RSPEIKKEPASVPLMDSKPEVGKKASQEDRFSIQVASYRGNHYARDLQSKLKSGNYPAYIDRQTIKGVLYYRVRVGPFSSRALALKVLASVRGMKDCGTSYIVSGD